ncbi:MAG TPA: protein kinase [Pyrinomonadaceae bacterium]|nr:protein kinase [Pyrinomonadaceae bacterium]
MSPEQWRQVKEIFHAALEVAPEERGSFLDKACSGDAALRREVESLIASHERTGNFIDSPAYEAAAHLLTDDPETLGEGQTVGDYRIMKKIGRGGMGEVYLARDTKLGRSVALKVLPVSFSQFTDRLRRFETEACAASALNHPNILTIYGMGQSDSRHFIATEFIEGETLRRHIPKEGMRVEDALDIAVQIASALQAAHEAGIIHRDVKPENIMVRRDGYVKVLDFGLAKLAADWRGDSGDAPTIQKTDSGAVMGTVQYMSPEQARGLSLDARTDIWSFGIVLYEMLAGRAPFDGETSSHTIVSILEDETPPLRSARPDAPPELERIVMRALRKQRDERYQSARELLEDLKQLKHRLDFQAELERSSAPVSKAVAASGQISGKLHAGEHEEDAASAETIRIDTARNTSGFDDLTRSVRRNWRWALLALFVPVAAFLASFFAYRYLSQRRVDSNFRQTSNTTTTSPALLRAKQVTTWAGLDIYPSFSPDGNAIVYSSDHSGSFELYIKQLTPGGREIQLTSDGQQNVQPAWSHDGKLIAYHSNKRGGIWVVPAFGGTPRQLTEFGSRPAWSYDSTQIAFQSQGAVDVQINSPGVQPPSTIWTVAAAGGAPQQVTHEGNPAGGHGSPAWSPDGRRIAFVLVTGGHIFTQLWSVERDGSRPKLLTGGKKSPASNFDPVYAPDGRSLYFIGGTGGRSWGILKLPISPETGEAAGEPEVVKETGWTVFRNLQFSADGKHLAHSALEMTSNLWSVQVSQAGEAVGQPTLMTQDTTFRKSSPAFSPDGKRVAYQRFVVGENHDIWLMDADGKNPTQLTTDPGSELFANWTPQGDKVLFLYVEPTQPPTVRLIDLQTGKVETLLSLNIGVGYLQLSPDGKSIAYNSTDNGVTNVWTVSLEDRQPKQLTFDKEMAGFPRWSPDGRFIVFESRRDDSSHLMIIPREGGEPKQLTFGEGHTFTGGLSPDGNRISFAGYRNSAWNICWVGREGGAEKQVTNNQKLNVFLRYPVWSPLGNQIVYEYAEVKGNIWITDLE